MLATTGTVPDPMGNVSNCSTGKFLLFNDSFANMKASYREVAMEPIGILGIPRDSGSSDIFLPDHKKTCVFAKPGGGT